MHSKSWLILKASILDIGLIDPLVINDQGQILDGRHRYRACQQLGIKPFTVHLQAVLGANYDKVTEAKFIFDVNCHRRHLTEDQRAALAEKFIPLFREQAQANLKVTQQKGPKKRLVGSNQSKSTRSQLAEVAKVSGEKARQVIKLHDGSPELLAQVKTGEKKLAEAVHDLDLIEPNVVAEVNRLHKEISAPGRTTGSPRQRKLRSASKYDYGKVDKQWLKFWPRFLSRYEKASWPIVREFVIDSLQAEKEAEQGGVTA